MHVSIHVCCCVLEPSHSICSRSSSFKPQTDDNNKCVSITLRRRYIPSSSHTHSRYILGIGDFLWFLLCALPSECKWIRRANGIFALSLSFLLCRHTVRLMFCVNHMLITHILLYDIHFSIFSIILCIVSAAMGMIRCIFYSILTWNETWFKSV